MDSPNEVGSRCKVGQLAVSVGAIKEPFNGIVVGKTRDGVYLKVLQDGRKTPRIWARKFVRVLNTQDSSL